jgi:hypothetical protein
MASLKATTQSRVVNAAIMGEPRERYALLGGPFLDELAELAKHDDAPHIGLPVCRSIKQMTKMTAQKQIAIFRRAYPSPKPRRSYHGLFQGFPL